MQHKNLTIQGPDMASRRSIDKKSDQGPFTNEWPMTTIQEEDVIEESKILNVRDPVCSFGLSQLAEEVS